MQRFDLFESGNADVADTTAATTATVPDTTELPAGSVRMPDLTGKTRDDAEAELARAGYKGEPIYCGSYSYTADENTVLEQFPAKNIIFNAEDAVELTVSLGRAPDTMPDITTLTEKDAFASFIARLQRHRTQRVFGCCSRRNGRYAERSARNEDRIRHGYVYCDEPRTEADRFCRNNGNVARRGQPHR